MKHRAFSAALLGGISTMTAADAQDDTVIYELDPVIISSQYHDQLAKDVPISVTAVPEKELDARKVKRVTDVVNDAPNTLATTQRGGNDATSIVIRGVGTTAFGAGPSVAVYVDDVYVGADSGFNLSLPDLKQVEILRGPQGTLAGRGALAGSVSLETGDPELGITETDLKLRYGSNAYTHGELTQNIALGENTALRFSLQRSKDDGWVTNRQGGPDLDSEDTTAARVKLLHRVTDNWDAIVTADYSKDQGRTRAYGPIATVLKQGVNSAQPYGEKAENAGFSVHNIWQTETGQLESITAWRKSENTIRPGTAAPVAVDLGFGARDYSQMSQELRLTGANEDLQWTLGAFLLKSEDDRQEALTLVQNVPLSATFTLPQGYTESSDSVVKTKSSALFADATYSLTDTLDLVTGLRLSYDRTEIAYRHSGNLGFSVFGLSQSVNNSVTTRSVSPRLGLNWAVTPEANLYATVSSAYKPAGFNIAFANTTDLGYAKEKAINYEVGAKGTAFDGDVSYALSAFYMDWRDQQVLTVNRTTGAFFISNAPKSRSYGLELQADAKVSDRTLMQFGLGYNKATFEEFANAPTGDASGLSQPLAPEYSVGLGLQHIVELPGGDLTLRGYYNWRSAFFFDASNLVRQSAYGLLDLSASYDAGAWTATFYVDNALDKAYPQAGGNVPAQGGLMGYPGKDRTIGFELSTTF